MNFGLHFASVVRREPEDALDWESECVLPQSGHSTDVTELAVNRLRSMATTVLENVHLGDALGGHWFFRHFHRFRRVLLLVFLDRLPFGLFPIRAIFRLCVLIFDRSVRTCSINNREQYHDAAQAARRRT